MEQIEIAVQNIKCDGCVKSIKAAFEHRAEIKEVEVSKETGIVYLKGDGLAKDKLMKELTALGYPPVKEKTFFDKLKASFKK